MIMETVPHVAHQPEEGPAVSLKDLILTSNDITIEQVPVPEWGVTVELRSLDVDSFTAIQRASATGSGDTDLRQVYLSMIVAGVYDPETGQPVFTDADKPALAQKSMQVTERLVSALSRLSGMGEKADIPAAVDAEGKDS